MIFYLNNFRELEDKLQKVQLQFEKAAIESKRFVFHK